MSNDVAWAVTRNSSRYLLKKRNCPKPFLLEPMNLTNKHSQRYSGLCNSKAIGVAFPAGGEKAQGFQVVLKKPKAGNKPAKSTTVTALKTVKAYLLSPSPPLPRLTPKPPPGIPLLSSPSYHHCTVGVLLWSQRNSTLL